MINSGFILSKLIWVLLILHAGGEKIACCSHSRPNDEADVEIIPLIQPNPKNTEKLIVCSKNLKVLADAPRPIVFITVLDELVPPPPEPPADATTEAPPAQGGEDYCSANWDEPCVGRDEMRDDIPDVCQSRTMLEEDDDEEVLTLTHQAATKTLVHNQDSDDPCSNVKNSYYLRIADKEKTCGAWLLSKPIPITNCLNEKTSVFIIFLKDVCKDYVVNTATVRLFTVTALLSSHMQYNSHCPVGINTIQKLSKFTHSFHDLVNSLKKRKIYGNNEMAKLRAPPFTWEFKGYNLEELSYTPKKAIRRIIKCQPSPTLIEIFPRVTVNHIAGHTASLCYDLVAAGRVNEVLNDTSASAMRMAPITIDGDRITGKKFTTYIDKLVQLVNNEKCSGP